MKRAVLVLCSIALVFAVAVACTGIAARWRDLPTSPPNLDRSTPATQGAYTLLRLLPASPNMGYDHNPMGSAYEWTDETHGGFRMWISSPDLPPPLTRSETFLNHATNRRETRTYQIGARSGGNQALTLSVRTPQGDAYPLTWEVVTGREGRFLCTAVPGGYPDSYSYLDVVLRDAKGRGATWRFTGLPPSRRTIAEPVKIVDRVHQQGVTLHARAVRSTHDGFCTVTAYLGGNLDAPSAHQWEVGVLWPVVTEWTPSGTPGSTMRPDDSWGGLRLAVRDQGEMGIGDRGAPYRLGNRFARIDAAAREFDTHDEVVTFTNVQVEHGEHMVVGNPRMPQTVATPSGIRLTLNRLDRNGIPRYQMAGLNKRPEVTVEVSIANDAQRIDLPRSPLAQRYRRPVLLQLLAGPGLQHAMVGGWDSGRARLLLFDLPASNPKVIARLPIVVRQRVDLRSIPFTFTVPIKDKSAERAPVLPATVSPRRGSN